MQRCKSKSIWSILLVIIALSVMVITIKYIPKASTPEYPLGYPKQWEVCITRSLLSLFAKNDDSPFMVEYIFPTSCSYELKKKIESFKKANPHYEVLAYSEDGNVISCDVSYNSKIEFKFYLPQINSVVNGAIEKYTDSIYIRFASYYNFEDNNSMLHNVLFKLMEHSYIPVYPAKQSSFYMSKIGNERQDFIVYTLDSIMWSIGNYSNR